MPKFKLDQTVYAVASKDHQFRIVRGTIGNFWVNSKTKITVGGEYVVKLPDGYAVCHGVYMLAADEPRALARIRAMKQKAVSEAIQSVYNTQKIELDWLNEVLKDLDIYRRFNQKKNKNRKRRVKAG